MQIHADKLRWLLWLRLKLWLRSFTRKSGRVSSIVGSVILLLFMLIGGGSLAVGTFFGYRFAPAPINAEILFLVLTGVYLLWIFAPLMQVATNEGLDVSKLTLFPLTRGELMVSLLLSTLLDTWTIFVVLLFGAVVVGWAFSLPLALMAVLTMLVFYVQLVGISQLVLALLARTLRSRRMRDLSVIIVVLFSASGYLCQFAIRGLGSSNFLGALQSESFSRSLQWFPPGMAARAIQQASIGNWGASFAWLSALIVLSVLVLYLWQIVIERALTAPESGGAAPRVRRRRAAVPAAVVPGTESASVGILGRLRASQTLAIAVKDLKYFWRDPQLKAMLFQSLLSMVFLVAITLVNTSGARGGASFLGHWAVMIAPFYPLLALYALSFNTLGLERQSLTTLLLFPIDPKRILLGKNLVVFAIGLLEVILITCIAAFISHAWDFVLPALAVGLAGLGILLGCGNFTSTFFPQRMRLAGRGLQSMSTTTAEGGCLRVVMSMVSLLAMLVILIPAALALILPVVFQVQWLWAFSIPASLLYGAAFYYAITALAAPRILNKAPEILAVVTKE